MSSKELSLPNNDSVLQLSDGPIEEDFEISEQLEPLQTVKNHFSQASNTFTNNTNTSNKEPSTFDKEETRSL